MVKFVSLTLCGLLTGCSVLSGFDARSSFSCRAPDGIFCESMSGIYSNAVSHNLPGQKAAHYSDTENTPVATAAKALVPGMPLRSRQRVIRVWFSLWEDNDGDLHDQHFVYMPIDSGGWVITHNHQNEKQTLVTVNHPLQTHTEGISTPTEEKETVIEIGKHQGKAMPEGEHGLE